MVAFPSSPPSVSLRSKPIILSLSALVIIAIVFIWTPIPSGCDAYGDGLVCRVTDKAKNVLPSSSSHSNKWRPTELKDIKSKYAFATYLAGSKEADWDDPFFIGVRLLTYQLLHAEDTASVDRSIPFIVLVTKNVSQDKRLRLQKDGAVVIEGSLIDGKWVKTETAGWKDILAKLHLWELTQFERVALLDGDTVLTRPLDGLFQDPAVTEMQTTQSKPEGIKADEGKMPATYSFASFPEMRKKHGYPPTVEHDDFPNPSYLNAGFFVMKPSLEMQSYYFSLFDTPDRFDPGLMEQNLLNYAHRPSGNMPWTTVNNTWNLHMALPSDIEGGVASVHSKWWDPLDPSMKPWLAARRWRMEGYFEAMDKQRGDVGLFA